MLLDNTPVTQLPRSRLLPRDYEELSRWMCVDPCGVDAPAAAWLQPDVGGDERMEATFRMQGFVEKMALSMLGNWNG